MTAVKGPAGTRWPGCSPPGADRWQDNPARAVQELQVVGAGSPGLSAGARVPGGAKLGQEDLSWKRPAPLLLLSRCERLRDSGWAKGLTSSGAGDRPGLE